MIAETLPDNIGRHFKMKITPVQSEAIRHILFFANREGCTDPRQIAYILATAYHEARFQPIPEIRAKPGTQVWKMQEEYWHTGYYGRGLCQLTWKKNYQKFQDLLGLPLVENPDLVLDVKVSAEILVIGMLRGLFSGVSLSRYFPPAPACFEMMFVGASLFHDYGGSGADCGCYYRNPLYDFFYFFIHRFSDN